MGAGVRCCVRVAGPLAGALATLLAATPLQGQEDTGTVAGRVTEAGRALRGAQVVVCGTGRGALTDSTSRYRIENVPAGEVKLRVRLMGYRDTSRTVTVRPGRVTTADFALVVNEGVVDRWRVEPLDPPDSVFFEKALTVIRTSYAPDILVDPRPLDPEDHYDYEDLPEVDASLLAARKRAARRLGFELVEVPADSTSCRRSGTLCVMVSLSRHWDDLPSWARERPGDVTPAKYGPSWSVRSIRYPPARDHGSTSEFFFQPHLSTDSWKLVGWGMVPLGG